MKLKIIFSLLIIMSFSMANESLADEKKQKSLGMLKETGRCSGIINFYVNRGGELTEGNRKYFAKMPENYRVAFDQAFKESQQFVNNCRSGNPSDSALHERCAKQLPEAKQVIYEAFLDGNAQMRNAYQAKDQSKIGVLLLSCSAV